MSLPAFDTHAYVKRFKAAGFSETQAEAQAELQAQVLSSLVTEKLATKDDIAGQENELTGEIKNVTHELTEKIEHVENETKQEFIRIAGRFNQLNWMTGFLLTGVATVLFKLFLHS